MPVTNKPVKIRSADLYRIQNDKIVEHWDVVDPWICQNKLEQLLLQRLNHKI